MAPTNSRPPLTSRIRASFEGKRSHSEAATYTKSNGIASADPETLRKAIEEAINSETFQTAIAANLANLIKPSIKTALDTIQPVVETVYQHEVLLRKANASVENLLERFDTNHERAPQPSGEGREANGEHTESNGVIPAALPTVEQFKQILAEYNTEHTAKTLSELSSAVQANHKMLADVITSVEDIHADLSPTKEQISSLKSISEQSTTATSVMQAQLDQLQVDVASIVAALGNDLGSTIKEIKNSVTGQDMSLLETHTTRLDGISSDLTELKNHSTKLDALHTISENVNALKDHLHTQAGAHSSHFEGLASQISGVLTAVQAHGSRSADGKAEILNAVKETHGMHASHTAALEELRSRDLSGSSTDPVPHENSMDLQALENISSDLASLRDNLNVRLDTNGTSFATLGTKIDTVLDAVEAIKDSDVSAHILEGVQKSNESHASHNAILENLQERSLVSGDAAPSSTGGNVETLEPHLENIIKTLDLHTATLATIPSRAPVEHVPETINDDISLEPKLDTIITILETHTALLTDLKDADVSEEILTAIHSCNEAQNVQATALTELKEADVSAEILTALHESNESHVSHTVVLGDIKAYTKSSNDSHAEHAEALEGLNARLVAAPGSDAYGSVDPAVDAKMSSLVTILEDHSLTLAEIKDAVHAAHDRHDTHDIAFEEIKGHGATLAAIKESVKAANDSHSAHAAALGEIKSNDASPEILSALNASNESHASHSAILADLKAQQAQDNAATAANFAPVDLPRLESQLDAMVQNLDAQKLTLAEIRTSSEDPTVLTVVKSNQAELLENLASLKSIVEESRDGLNEHGSSVKALHEDTKASHNGLSDAIKALVIGGAGGAGAEVLSHSDNSEVLDAVKAVKDVIEAVSAKIDSVKGDIEESEMTLKSIVKDVSNEIKSEIDASSTDLGASIGTLSGDVQVVRGEVKGVDVTSLKTAVDSYGKDIKAISTAIEVLEEQVRNTGSNVVDLSEALESGGLSAQKKGIEVEPVLDEQNWMKRSTKKEGDGGLQAHLAAPAQPTSLDTDVFHEERLSRPEDEIIHEEHPSVQEEPVIHEEAALHEDSEAIEEAPVAHEEAAPEEDPLVHKEDQLPTDKTIDHEEVLPSTEEAIAHEEETAPVHEEDPAHVEEVVAQEEGPAPTGAAVHEEEQAPIEESLHEEVPASTEESVVHEETSAPVEVPIEHEEDPVAVEKAVVDEEQPVNIEDATFPEENPAPVEEAVVHEEQVAPTGAAVHEEEQAPAEEPPHEGAVESTEEPILQKEPDLDASIIHENHADPIENILHEGEIVPAQSENPAQDEPATQEDPAAGEVPTTQQEPIHDESAHEHAEETSAKEVVDTHTEDQEGVPVYVPPSEEHIAPAEMAPSQEEIPVTLHGEQAHEASLGEDQITTAQIGPDEDPVSYHESDPPATPVDVPEQHIDEPLKMPVDELAHVAQEDEPKSDPVEEPATGTDLSSSTITEEDPVPPHVPDPPISTSDVPPSHIVIENTPLDEHSVTEPDTPIDEPEEEPTRGSLSTSEVTSPTSPAFATDSGSASPTKGSKKGKKDKKEKKGKKGKKEAFVFDPDEEGKTV